MFFLPDFFNAPLCSSIMKPEAKSFCSAEHWPVWLSFWLLKVMSHWFFNHSLPRSHRCALWWGHYFFIFVEVQAHWTLLWTSVSVRISISQCFWLCVHVCPPFIHFAGIVSFSSKCVLHLYISLYFCLWLCWDLSDTQLTEILGLLVIAGRTSALWGRGCSSRRESYIRKKTVFGPVAGL